MAEFHNTLILKKNNKHSKILKNVFLDSRSNDIDFMRYFPTSKEVAVLGFTETDAYSVFSFDSGGAQIEDSLIYDLMNYLRHNDCKTAYGHIWADELGECLISIKNGCLESVEFNEESDSSAKIMWSKSGWRDRGFHLYTLIDDEFEEDLKKYNEKKKKKNRTSYNHEEITEILNDLMSKSNDDLSIDNEIEKLSSWEINLFFRILICQYFESLEEQNALMLKMIDTGRIDMETRIFFWKEWDEPESAPPLFWAMYHGHINVVERMLKLNAPFLPPVRRNARSMKSHIQDINRYIDDNYKKYIDFDKCLTLLNVDLDAILEA